MASPRTRPLSPHLTIYRNPLTSYLSMANRMAQVALSIASLGFIYWLYAIASGSETYQQATAFFSAWPMVIIEIGIAQAFFYHICMEICHMIWDTARGLDGNQGTRNSIVTFIASLIINALFWAGIFYL